MRSVLAQLQDPRKRLESSKEINGWGNLHIWRKVLERHFIVCGRKQQNMVAVFARGRGERRVTSYRGNDGRWAHYLPGKPAEEHAPHRPFDKKNHQQGWGKYTGRSFSCVGRSWSRHWLGWRCSCLEWPDHTLVLSTFIFFIEWTSFLTSNSNSCFLSPSTKSPNTNQIL